HPVTPPPEFSPLSLHDALPISGTEISSIAEAVAVLHGSGEHVGDRLDSAMRVPREAGQVIVRVVVSKIVKQQKRIELARVSKTRSEERRVGKECRSGGGRRQKR